MPRGARTQRKAYDGTSGLERRRESGALPAARWVRRRAIAHRRRQNLKRVLHRLETCREAPWNESSRRATF